MAKPKLERSGVSNAETGAEEVDDIRTSSGMFFSRGQNPLVARIEARIAAWTMLPVKNGEGVQVLQYLVRHSHTW
jgi:prolyl 4-hydroxylase